MEMVPISDDRVIITDDDLDTAARFIEEYLARRLYNAEGTTPDGFIADAVTLAIVVTYARPFTAKNDRCGDPEPSLSFLSKDLPEPELHKWIISARHKEFAHSDASQREVRWNDPLSTLQAPPPLKEAEAVGLFKNIARMRALLKPYVLQLPRPFLRVRPGRTRRPA